VNSLEPVEGFGLENEPPAARAAEARETANRAHANEAFRPILAMGGAIVLWGGSFIATKAAVQDMPPVGFALLRFVLATATLVGAMLATRTRVVVPRKLWGRMVVVGLLGVTLSYVLENVALKYTTAGNAGLFISATPLLTIAGAVLFQGDRLNWSQMLGVIVATAAIFHLVGANFAATGAGDALMIVTMVVGTLYALLSKTLAEKLPLLVTLTVSFAIGTIGLIPCAAAEYALTGQAWTLTPRVFGALAYLGLGASCLACWFWMYALRHMSSSRVGIYMYGMPVVTLACSHWLLGEPFGWLKLFEAALILLGVYLASAKPAGTAI
jgi:drug/metabolite transporter (DMT)-like permease